MFLARLAKSEKFDAAVIEQLGTLLKGKKVRSDDLIRGVHVSDRYGGQVIKLESAHIEEVRGIRKLDIDFSKGTFAISGPNGSGKSGVIDAIEFALTGQIESANRQRYERLIGR